MITGIHHISMKCGTAEEFEKAKDFYLNILGFQIKREWPGGMMIDAGNCLLEIFSNGTGIRAKGAIRHIAFGTDDVDGIVQKVKASGYEGKNHPQKHHLYVCPQDSVELKRHVSFRDYLRSHPEAVREYSRIKEEGAALFPCDIEKYIEYKSPFIERVYLEMRIC